METGYKGRTITTTAAVEGPGSWTVETRVWPAPEDGSDHPKTLPTLAITARSEDEAHVRAIEAGKAWIDSNWKHFGPVPDDSFHLRA
ncbi:MAG: hypothetical protein H8K03_21130 [Nitrospira sp.]|jgi:hypothetical protein|nr:hypothetical protein [Nitrospira sp. BO4]